MNDILISVIIPIYNAENTLRRCLDSVMSQTHSNLEIICVDDGSTDGTMTVLEEYCGKDQRIKVIRQENAGAGAARNNGIEAANGQYFSFLDSDDFFEPKMYELMLEAATGTESDIVVCESNSFDVQSGSFSLRNETIIKKYLPDKEVFSSADVPERIFNIFRGYPWDKLFRADFIREEKLRFQDLRNSNDMFFVYMSLALAKKITTVDKLLVHKGINYPGSISTSGDKQWDCFYKALTQIKAELTARGIFEPLERSFINRALNNITWNIRVIDGEGFKKAYRALQDSWLEELGFSGKDPSYFYNKKRYETYLRIKELPMDDYLLAVIRDLRRELYDERTKPKGKLRESARKLPFAAKVYRRLRRLLKRIFKAGL